MLELRKGIGTKEEKESREDVNKRLKLSIFATLLERRSKNKLKESCYSRKELNIENSRRVEIPV